VSLTKSPHNKKEAGAAFVKILSDSHFRAACFIERANECHTSPQRVRRIFRYFLQRGMRAEAVASSLPNCGHKNDRAWATSAVKPEGVDAAGKRNRYGINHGPKVGRRYQSCPGPKPQTSRGARLVPGVIKNRILELMADIWVSTPLGDWVQDLPGAFFSEDACEDEWKCDITAKKGGRRAHRGKRSRPTHEQLARHANFLLRRIPESIVRNPETGDILSMQLRSDDRVSARMVQYFIQKLPPEVKAERELGEHNFALNHAPLRGHALSHIRGPGDVFQIDATVMDVYLVSMLTPARVVSRPTLYLIIDVFSRMVTGFYVGFEYPSMEACALALENMVMDKSEFCAFYGLNDVTFKVWPCMIVPNVLQGDRGREYMKLDVWRRVEQNFGIEITNCRPYFPIGKSIVETRFGIIPHIMARNSCGIVEKHIEGRPHRYPLDAIYDTRSVTRQIIRAITTYHRTPLPDETAIPDMVAHGKPNTPLERWQWGMENISGNMSAKVTVNDIRLATWTPTKAKIGRAGIECRDAYYRFPGNIVGAESQTTVLCGPQMSQIIYKPYETPIICDLADTNRVRLSGVDYLDYEDHLEKAGRLAGAAKDKEELQDTIDQLNSQHESQRAIDRRDEALRAQGLKRPVTGDAATARKTESDIQHGRRRSVAATSGVVPTTGRPVNRKNGDAATDEGWKRADEYSKKMQSAALSLLSGKSR
jgi:hypothetical protein